ncbi:MAG: hypothetical protein ACRELD_05560 [Longimicrobiales bacterium]
MIVPNARASFGRAEAGIVLGLLANRDSAARVREEERLREEGFDSLLDDPRTLNALLTASSLSGVSPGLIYYVLVRHALLEVGVKDRLIADYVAALLFRFGLRDHANRIEERPDERFDYIVDIVAALSTATGRDAFMLHAHLGNFALWVSGIFPDRISALVQRRGAPDLGYYEEMGTTGYRLASESSDASRYGLGKLLRNCAETFPTLRVALNRVSDRYFFPQRGDPVERLLRQVRDDVRNPATSN